MEPFAYHDILGGHQAQITRRDPSPVIRVGDTFHLWYSRTTTTAHGYTATIWHATSADGQSWREQGQALGRGPVGAWDEHGVFTPSILVADGRYYLSYTGVPEPFYQGFGDQPPPTKTHIGLAVSDDPNGAFKRCAAAPILAPSDDPACFDSMRVDDSCFIVREGRYWLYYKGRQLANTPAQTKMGLAIADAPAGPYRRHSAEALVNGGHEVCVWPWRGGVAGLFCNVGAAGNTLQWAPDGIHFRQLACLVPPKAPGPYRGDAFADGADCDLHWGISMVSADWPYLQRFDANLTDLLAAL